jgi:hypothetical protein
MRLRIGAHHFNAAGLIGFATLLTIKRDSMWLEVGLKETDAVTFHFDDPLILEQLDERAVIVLAQAGCRKQFSEVRHWMDGQCCAGLDDFLACQLTGAIQERGTTKVCRTIDNYAAGKFTVAPGTTGLLVVRLQTAGHVAVDHETYIGLIEILLANLKVVLSIVLPSKL